MFCPLRAGDLENECNLELCAPARMIGGNGKPVCPIAEIASGVGLLCMVFATQDTKEEELTPLQKKLKELGVDSAGG